MDRSLTGTRARRAGRSLLVAPLAVLVVVALVSPAAAQPVITPSSIAVASTSSVCTGGSQAFPVSITLPAVSVVDKVDIGLVLDDTGSFASFGPTVAGIFSSLVTELQAALPGVDFGYGVSRFEDFGGPGTTYSGDTLESRPFILNQPVINAATAGGATQLNTTISNALSTTTPGFGGDSPETGIEALGQVATGTGFDGNGNGSSLNSGAAGAAATQTTPGDSGDVPPFSSNTAPTSGTQGGLGFRPDALHLVMVATDVGTVTPFPTTTIPANVTGAGSTEPTTAFDAFGRFGPVGNAKSATDNTVPGAVAPSGSATLQNTVNALNALGIRVLGMGPGAAPTTSTDPDSGPSTWLSAIARLTGAVDETGTPLVFDTSVSSTELRDAIVDAISTTATNPIDIGLTAGTLPAGLTFTPTPASVADVGPGETANFSASFQGNGTAITGSFDLDFIDTGSNAVLGSIPVTVNCGTTPAGFDLAVTQTATPTNVAAGGQVTYRITLTNNGPATAPAVALRNTIPSGTTLVSATSTPGGCSGVNTARQLTCLIGTLASGASATINVVVTAPSTLGARLVNSATIVAIPADNNAANNTATATATVAPPDEQVASGFVAPGGTITTGAAATGDDPTVSGLTLPNTGSGANITLIERRGGRFCGGPCGPGQFTILRQFPGYNNYDNPPILRLRYDKTLGLTLTGKVYIKKNGVAGVVPPCSKKRVSPCVLSVRKLGPKLSSNPADWDDIEVRILVLGEDPRFRYR